jgi:hypothetical protein
MDDTAAPTLFDEMPTHGSCRSFEMSAALTDVYSECANKPLEADVAEWPISSIPELIRPPLSKGTRTTGEIGKTAAHEA